MKNLFARNFIKMLHRNYKLVYYIGCHKQNYCASRVVALQVIKLQEKSFIVNPNFGKLILNSSCNCIIQPTKLQDNCASITLWGVKMDGPKLELDAELQDDNNTLKLDVYPNTLEALCEINMPIKYDIEANMEDNATIQLEKMEGGSIEIGTQKGSITMKSVKSGDISITTNTGHVTADVLQGNCYINARKTSIKAKRLQGLEVCIQASQLDTQIESSYVDKGIIFAERGNISIKNLHGSTTLHLHEGKLNINGLHGSLQAVVNEGEADLQVSKVTGNSLIQVDRGMLNLSLIDASLQNLDTSSPQLEISPDIKRLGSESVSDEGLCNFKTSLGSSLPNLWASVSEGKLKLSVKDWFSSLQIKGNS